MRLPVLLPLLLALFLFSGASLLAASWTGMGMTGNWTDAGNWSGNQVPGPGDEAYIGAGFSPYLDTGVSVGMLIMNAAGLSGPGTLTVNTSMSLDSCSIGAAVTLLQGGSGLITGTFGLGANLTNYGEITNNTYTICSNCEIINYGTYNAVGGYGFGVYYAPVTFQNHGLLRKPAIPEGTFTCGIELKNYADGEVRVEGGELYVSVNFANYGDVAVQAGGVLNVHNFQIFDGTAITGAGQLKITGNGAYAMNNDPVQIDIAEVAATSNIGGAGQLIFTRHVVITGGSFGNLNTFALSCTVDVDPGPGANPAITNVFTNNGHFNINANLTFSYGSLVNNGVLALTGPYNIGIVAAGPGIFNHGTVIKPAASQGTFTMNFPLKNETDGELLVQNGELYISDLTNAGHVGIAADASLRTHQTLVLDNATFTGDGVLKIYESGLYAQNTNPVSIDVAELELNGQQFGGTGTMVLTRHVNWISGAMSTTVNFAAGAVVDINYVNNNGHGITGTLTNHGTVNFNDGLQFSTGSLTNYGLISLNSASTISIYAASIGIFNHGLVRKPANSTGTFVMAVPLTNYADGTVAVENGELKIDGGLNNSGSVTIGAGGVLRPHQLEVYDGSTIGGAGQLIIYNNGLHTNNTADLTLTVAEIELSSNIQGGGPLTFTGHINWVIGTFATPTTFAASAVVDVVPGNYHNFFSTLTLDGTLNVDDPITGESVLTNHGVINLLANYTGTALYNHGLIRKNTGADASLQVELHNDGTVQTPGGNLYLTGSLINAGAVEIAAGANVQLEGYGISSLETGSVLTGAGTFTMNTNLAVNADLSIDVETFVLDYYYGLSGTATLTFPHRLDWRGGGIENRVVIASGGTADISGSDYGKSLLGTLTNNGTVHCSADLFLNFAAAIDNNGVFHLTGDGYLGTSASYYYSGQFNNAGQLDKTSAGTSACGLLLNNMNGGTIDVNAGTLDVARLDNAGPVNVAGGALLIVRDGANLPGSTLGGSGALRLAGNGWTLSNTLTVSSLTLEIDADLQGDPGATLEVQSTAHWLSGSLHVPVNVAVAGTFYISGNAYRTLQQPINNAGTVNLSTSFSAYADLTNSGTFLLTGDNGGFFSGGGATFHNTGLVQSTCTYGAYLGMSFVNHGSIDIQSATLYFTDGLANHGTVTIAAGATLDLSGESSFQAGSTVNAAGSIRAGGSLTLQPDFVFSGENFQLFGNLEGPGRLTVDSHMDWFGGSIETDVTIAGSGALIIGGGGGGNSSKSAAFSSSGHSLRATLTNHGSTEQQGDYDLDGGAFFNDGTFDSYGSTLYDGGNGGALTNNGVWNVHYSFSAYVPAVNNGTLNGEGYYLTFEPELENHGAVSPGFPVGAMRFYHDYPSGTELDLEVQSSDGPGAGHDYIQAEEHLQLGGALVVTETGSPLDGEYVILHCNGGPDCRTGEFASTTLPVGYALHYTGNEVILTKGQPATVSPADTAICSGGGVLLTASAGDSYQWSTGENTQSVEVFPYNTTTYSVTVYDGNGGGSLGHATVQVNPAPYVYVDPWYALLCQGESVTLNAYSDATDFVWSTGETTASITVQPTEDTNYYVTVSNAGGCSATAGVAVYTNPTPPVTPAITGLPATVCQNDYGFYLETYQDGIYGSWSGPGVYGGYYYDPYGLSGPQLLTFTPSPSQCATTATWTIEVTPGAFYADNDGDGYGDPEVWETTCVQPAGYVTDHTDCDDSNADVHPGATEVANGLDDNCDGQIDEHNALSAFYADTDGDGYGDPNQTVQAVSAPEGYVADNTDCNDANAGVHPGATEICNGLDDDCDGWTDENVQSTFYADADGDGYGDAAQPVLACSAPEGYVADNTDCNDANAGVHPGATEICNGLDDDCDGWTDETDLALQLTAGTIACANGTTMLSATATGGAAPYQFSLDGGTFGASHAFTVGAGPHTVAVQDAHGCTVASGIGVAAAAALTIDPVVVTHVACGGGNTGAIDITVAGGTAPYTYHWSNNKTTQDLGSLAAGAYTVTVTATGGCTATASATVNPKLKLTVGKTNTGCPGGNDGTATATGSGGTPAYTYAWSTGATTATISGLTPGTYGVTLSDALGCTRTANVSIGQPAAMAISGVVTPAACNGSATGSVLVSVNNGVLPFTYAWSDGGTTKDRTDLPAGVHSLTVTDANGCTRTKSFTITQPAVLNLHYTVNDADCDGSITLTGTTTGGTAPYRYSFGDSAFGPANAFPVTAGNHTLTVRDDHGCTQSATITLEPWTPITVAPIVVTNVVCAGGNTGAIDITVSGGIAPCTYRWSNNKTTQDLANINAGAYTVTVTSAGGCTTTATATVNPALKLTVSKTNTTCNAGNDGTATATATGGTPAYAYAWSTGATTATITGLPPGTYGVTLTDALGCTRSANVAVGQPAAIGIAGTVTPAACNGSATGAIAVTVTNGTAPFAFNWSDGGTAEDRTGLEAGTYAVIVTDANGCTREKTFTVGQPTALTLSLAVVNVACNGAENGKITATVGGGVKFPTSDLCNGEPYCYQWSTGATSRIVTGLEPGTYEVAVTDAHGCRLLGAATVAEPAALAIAGVVSDPLPNGKYKVIVTADGGTAPYQYKRIPGGGFQNGNVFNNVPAGAYQVVVQDKNGCSTSVNVDVPGGGQSFSRPTPHPADPTATNDALLYPNPATEAVQVQFARPFATADVRVFDGRGRQVLAQHWTDRETARFDVSAWDSGLYFVQFRVDGERFVRRLSVLR